MVKTEKRVEVTITERLKLTVTVEAENEQQAEQMVFDDWRNGRYVLGADDFAYVEMKANSLSY